MRVRSPAFGGSWVPVFDAATQLSASQSCWPVGLDQQSLYCVIGPAAQPWPQVCVLSQTTVLRFCMLQLKVTFSEHCAVALQVKPRPVLSVVDLQVPVLGGESDFGRLEAQLLCMQTHLAHLRDLEVSLCLFCVS